MVVCWILEIVQSSKLMFINQIRFEDDFFRKFFTTLTMGKKHCEAGLEECLNRRCFCSYEILLDHIIDLEFEEDMGQ